MFLGLAVVQSHLGSVRKLGMKDTHWTLTHFMSWAPLP